MSAAKKFITQSEILQSLHGPFFPSDVRAGEPISATLKIEETQQTYSLRVWKLSPLGIELLNDENILLEKGNSVSLSINVGNETGYYDGLVVDQMAEEGSNNIIGIRLVKKDTEINTDANRRTAKRWVTSSQFLPTGMAPNPAKYNDFIFFRVKDISADGMQLTTSLRNKFLLVGMKLDTSVSFPMIAQIRINFEIVNIRLSKDGNNENLSVGVKFIEKDTEMLETIGQYLTQFGNIDSLEPLLEQGLAPSTIGQAVSYSYVKTKEDYEEVLELRWLAYKKEGKLPEGAKPEDLADIFDSQSRIVIGRFSGKAVSTGRMSFNEYDQKFEQEDFVTWPSDFPRRDQSVEIMRVCTHPEFRGSDLLVSMFRFMATAVVQGKREWIILSTTDKYTSLYEKMGGKLSGLSFNLPALNNSKHHIILGNVRDSLTGKNLSPFYWNAIYGNLISYIESYNLIDLTPMDRIRISAYRMLSPITRFFEKYFIAPKRLERARLNVLANKGQD